MQKYICIQASDLLFERAFESFYLFFKHLFEFQKEESSIHILL